MYYNVCGGSGDRGYGRGSANGGDGGDGGDGSIRIPVSSVNSILIRRMTNGQMGLVAVHIYVATAIDK